MENASKALIIAGAILLAILLISLGIMIFNQAQDTVNNSGMTQAEITAFNNKFLKYEGEQKASVVKSLINEAISEERHTVTVKIGEKGKETATTATSGVVSSATYDVVLSYNDGLVSTITCTKK